MANWQQIGSGPVEYCVGTDGVVGISVGFMVHVIGSDGILEYCDNKLTFEANYCKPRHRLIESADGSTCVMSVEEQDGKPVRMAFVRTDSQGEWDVHWMGGWDVADDKQDAIDRAARYVETGE